MSAPDPSHDTSTDTAAGGGVWTIRRALSWTSARFAQQRLDSPRLDAEVLLAFVLGMERLGLYLDHDRPLSASELSSYRELIRRRLANEPVAYLTGQREFWSLPLTVGPETLIPRPETELLVAYALQWLEKREKRASPTVVDVGTGSGAIAVALAKGCSARVLASDISEEALAVARENAARHNVTVFFYHGDLLQPLAPEEVIDLIVANLPYVTTAVVDGLSPDVRLWEPRLALDGGEDGLRCIARLIEAAERRLRTGAGMALEIDPQQVNDSRALLEAHGFGSVEVICDLAGHPRVVAADRRH